MKKRYLIIVSFLLCCSFAASHAQTTYPVRWVDLINCTSDNNEVLTSSDASQTFDVSALSSNYLDAGVDGYFEFTVTSQRAFNIGFVSNTFSRPSTTRYIAGVGIGGGAGMISTYQGSTVAAKSNVAAGDVIRVHRVGSTITIYKNVSQVLEAITATPGKLWIKANIGIINGTTPPATCTFTPRIVLKKVMSGTSSAKASGSVSITATGGKAPYTYSWAIGGYATATIIDQPYRSNTVTVQDANGLTAEETIQFGFQVTYAQPSLATTNDNQLTRNTPPPPSWSAGAISTNRSMSANGSIQFMIEDYTSSYIVGFSDHITFSASGSRNEIMIDHSTGNASVREASTTYNLGPYRIGDVFRLEKTGTMINYYRNGTPVGQPATANTTTFLNVRTIIQYGTTPKVTASFDGKVLANVDVKGTSIENAGGKLKAYGYGGTPPYRYTWTDQADNVLSTADSLVDRPRGKYKLRIQDAGDRSTTHSYSVGYRPEYTKLVYTTFEVNNGFRYQRSNSSFGNSGFTTSNILPAGENGWIEIIVPKGGFSGFVLGLQQTEARFNPYLADFVHGVFYHGFGTGSGARLSYQANFTTTTLQDVDPGDVIRIEKNGTSLRYRINDELVGPSITVNNLYDYKIKMTVNGAVPEFTTSFPGKLEVRAKVVGTSVANNTGKIVLQIAGGTAPYSYTWTNGALGTDSVSNLSRGDYKVTVSDADGRIIEKTYRVHYKQAWMDVANVTALPYSNGHKMVTSGGYASSSNLASASTDAWLEFVTDNSGSDYMVGYTTSENLGDVNSFRYGIWIRSTGTYLIQQFVSGVHSGAYLPGDVFTMERIGVNVIVKKNGLVVFTGSNATGYDFRPKVGIYSGIAPGVTSKHDATVFPIVKVRGTTFGNNDGRLWVDAKGGAGGYTYSWSGPIGTVSGRQVLNAARGDWQLTVRDSANRETIRTYKLGYRQSYIDATYVQEDSLHRLNRSTPGGTTNAGANSSNILPPNTNGIIECVVTPSSTYASNPIYYFGFARKESVFDDTSIQFGFYVHMAYSNLFTLVDGVGTSAKSVQQGDVLKLERVGNTINFYQNGVLIRTTTNTSYAKRELFVKAVSNNGQVAAITSDFDAVPVFRATVVPATATPESIGQQILVGGVAMSVLGGYPPYNFQWSSGELTQSISAKALGDYTLSVTDDSGIARSRTYNIGKRPSWSHATDVVIDNKALVRTTGASWTAGALTIPTLNSGATGSLSFVVPFNASIFCVGFTNSITTYSNTSFIASALIDATTGLLYAQEGSTQTFIGTVKAGDVISIVREAGKYSYRKNGGELRLLTSTMNQSVRLKTSVFQIGAPVVTTSFEADDIAMGMNNLSFQYKYDSRRRMIAKKVPGAEWVYLIYDNRDRLVLTQDGNQRANNQWLFTKYDLLNRPVLSGVYEAASTPQAMQQVIDAFYNVALPTWGESMNTTATGIHGYTNATFPIVSDKFKYLSATYYDNYEWLGSPNSRPYVPGDVVQQESAEFTRITGVVTGTKIKVLDNASAWGGSTWLTSVSYYDDDGRVIQTTADNYKGGTDRTTNVYDFTGKVLKTKNTHTSFDVTWKDRKLIDVYGNKVTAASTGVANWNAGAVSTQSMAAGQDGWIEWVIEEPAQVYAVGFSPTNGSGSYSTKAAWNVTNHGLYLSENSAGIHPGTNFVAAKGDVLRVERTGSTYKWKKNGNTHRTVTLTSDVLYAAAQFYNGGGSISQLRASFAKAADSTLREYDYDHFGRLVKVWHTFNSEPRVLLISNEYNEVGQLIDKKLHSTNDGVTGLQSIDYRYNIRGWLTSVNGAELEPGNKNNDPGEQRKDLFGMDLSYNVPDASLNNDALYSGNISAMIWSKDQGLGTEKQVAYKYAYDAMNRLLSANFNRKVLTWSASNAFAEKNLSYDLNGNINTLQRRDKAGKLIDSLTYHYGGGYEKSNQLLKVVDTGNKAQGFAEGVNTNNDYVYDANGNMLVDQNKNITSPMSYNILNLPTSVFRGVNGNVRYVYDASGTKLSQVATYGNTQKQTDYTVGYQYEDDVLQFVSHEEGRIVVTGREDIFYFDGSSTSVATTTNATQILEPINGETYLKVTSTNTNAKNGIQKIGNLIPVIAGEKYMVRAKGYTTAGSADAFLYIKVGVTEYGWTMTKIPSGSASESWVEQIITVSASENLTAGVAWNAPTNVSVFYLNDFEIVKLKTTAPEYQYNLKDHLDNVRMTITSKNEIDSTTATLESNAVAAESSRYVRYDLARKVRSKLFDHTKDNTPGDTLAYSQRLNGTDNERIGLARSISVMPGDIIKAEVYAKYFNAEAPGLAGALTWLVGQLANNGASVIIDGAGYLNSSNSLLPINPINHTSETGNAPKAYINYIFANRDYVVDPLKSYYVRIDETAKENGTNVGHQKLEFSKVITEPGYVYIYLSNDNKALGGNQVEVYFDDFKVEHVKSPVVSSQDYYPFGLVFNQYSRENSVLNLDKYNSKELQDELNLGWIDYGARMHQPEIGRFFRPDRFSEEYLNHSPYQYAVNNPLMFVDINGDSVATAFYDKNGNRLSTIPDIVQKMFNSEYGISVGYNSKTGMLYYTGEVDTDNQVSESAKEKLVSALKDEVGGRKAERKYGYLAFGYGNFGDNPPPLTVTLGGSNRRVAWINLNDFSNDKNQSSNKIDYSDLDASGFSRRVFNLGRVFEHEWLGHVINKRGDGQGRMGPTVRMANEYYKEMGLPERLNYAMPIFFSFENSRSSLSKLRSQGRSGQTVPRVFYKRDK